MAKESPRWPRRIRRIVQAAAFVAFVVLVVRMPAMAAAARGDWLMRLSPLGGLGATISAWQVIVAFWPALVLLLAAVLLGRFFCGWLCPLGTTLDAGDRLIGALRGGRGSALRRTAAGESPGQAPDFEDLRARRLKYYLLTACLVGAFLGVSFFGLFDPLSIAVRSYVLVVHSFVARGVVALSGAFPLLGGGETAVRGALSARTDPVFQLQLLTLTVLAGLIALGLVRPRLWCRCLCPLGAIYALAGKACVPKRSVNDACTECGRCARVCPMACISRDGRRTLNDECILCLQCQPACPQAAVRFLARAPVEQRREVSLTRRGVLAAAASGLAAYPLLRTRWTWLHAKGDPVIRPPLAGRDVEAFLSKCLRCGQCMRVCPNQVIQPTGLEAGLESLWTPKLAPRPGYCEYNCNLCGQACPSGAIPRFSLPEKHQTAMGLAFVDTTRCIPWRGYERRGEAGFVADRHNCGVCEEVCPAPGKAIHFRRVYIAEGGQEAGVGQGQELRLPYVVPDACVGCGYCEAVCPVIGQAAIRVTGGFRMLPAPPAPAAPALTELALPASSGYLRLVSPKVTYTGAKELYDYIDGGAEAYLTFSFLRVTAAEYTDGRDKLKADLWEFGTSDDAFGAFAKDRRGEPAPVGDEGAVQGGSVWACRGRFMISVLNLGQVPLEQARLLATAALDALGEPPAERPAVCRRLPAGGLDPMSVVFMRDEKPLFNLYLAASFIPDGTFGIAGGAVAAYGAYGPAQEGKRFGLLLIEYGSAEAAAGAAGRLAKVRADWGEERVSAAPYIAFKPGEGNYCVIGARGPSFAAAFFAPSADRGAELLKAALEG